MGYNPMQTGSPLDMCAAQTLRPHLQDGADWSQL